MGRLIDADKAISDYVHYGISHPYDAYDLEDILTECPSVEAIPKADYENRLKADMVAMLTELQLEIEELYPEARKTYRDGLTSYCEGVDDSREIIQQKINALKGEQGENTN